MAADDVSSEDIQMLVEHASVLCTLSVNVLPLPQTVMAALSIQPSGNSKIF
jgi:hypothetical protein